MSKRKRRCACGRVFVPIDKQDEICEHCRYWRVLLYEKDVQEFERGRKKYNEAHGTHFTYGQFVLMLEDIERKRKNELAHRKHLRFKKL